METFVLIASTGLLLAALTAIVVLARQLQGAKIREVTISERLSAKEADLESLKSNYVQLSEDNSLLKSEIQNYREELAAVKTSLDLERRQFEEKLSLLNESREQLVITFKNIANEIFEDKSKKFTATNRETLNAVLSPLQERIQQFEKRVEETYDKESKERFSLAKEIENLQKKVAEKYGYTLVDHKLELYGVKKKSQ